MTAGMIRPPAQGGTQRPSSGLAEYPCSATRLSDPGRISCALNTDQNQVDAAGLELWEPHI